MSSRAATTVSALAIAGALMLTLSGCQSVVDEFISGFKEGLNGGETDVFAIQVGDCFNDDSEAVDEVTSVEMPECSEPHDNEAYHSYEVSLTGSYDEDAIVADAEVECAATFEEFIDASEAETSLYFGYFYPGTDSWEQNDREVLCLAFDLNGQVTGSLEGRGSEFPY